MNRPLESRIFGIFGMVFERASGGKTSAWHSAIEIQSTTDYTDFTNDFLQDSVAPVPPSSRCGGYYPARRGHFHYRILGDFFGRRRDAKPQAVVANAL